MFVNIAQLYTKKKMIVNNLHEEKGYLRNEAFKGLFTKHLDLNDNQVYAY